MLLPNSNLALISVPGPYAALEAHNALTRGLHVLLFSDHVPLSDEIELKSRAERLGLLMMGPGAGTSALGGTGLGFANGVRSGRVGVVAAAGTGAQELMSLIHRWGAGVSAVVGVGGRDLSDEVGGRMARLAIRAFERDANTEVLLLVSKPPSPSVAASILGELGAKPAVAALVGLERSFPAPPGVHLAGTMEEAAATVISLLGMPGALPSAG